MLAENQALAQWQARPNQPEELLCLPKLSLEDIGPMPEPIPTQVSQIGDTVQLMHSIDTRGTAHIRLYFSVADLPPEQFSWLSLLCDLFGDLPTQQYSPAQLQQRVKQYIGYLRIAPVSYAMPGKPDSCKPYIVVSISLLQRNLAPALALVADILKHTRFDDAQKIRQVVLQNCEDLSESIQERGDQFAGLQSLMHHSAAVALRERTDGCSLLLALEDLDEDFDRLFPNFTAFADNICKTVFTPQRLTISQTCKEALPVADILLPLLGQGRAVPALLQLPLPRKSLKKAIVTPSSISYTACGENLESFGQSFDGRMQLLSGLLSYSYLWNEIRVKGGAYGCAFGSGESGNLSFSSYEDPEPLNSLRVYGDTGRFLESFCQSEEALDKYIISTISALEPLSSPARLGAAADSAYFCGFRIEARLARRQEILHMDKQQLLDLVPLFDGLKDRCSRCILCPEDIAKQLDDSWDIQYL